MTGLQATSYTHALFKKKVVAAQLPVCFGADLDMTLLALEGNGRTDSVETLLPHV